MYQITLNILTKKTAEKKIKKITLSKMEKIFSSAINKEIKEPVVVGIKSIEAPNGVANNPPPRSK